MEKDGGKRTAAAIQAADPTLVQEEIAKQLVHEAPRNLPVRLALRRSATCSVQRLLERP